MPQRQRNALRELQRRLRAQMRISEALRVELVAAKVAAASAERREQQALRRATVAAADADASARQVHVLEVAAAAAAAASAARDATAAAAHASLEACKRQVDEGLRAARSDIRQLKSASKEAATAAELERRRLQREATAQLGSLRDEHRRQRLVEQRRWVELEGECIGLHAKVARLEDKIEILESHRVGGLLEEVAQRDDIGSASSRGGEAPGSAPSLRLISIVGEQSSRRRRRQRRRRPSRSTSPARHRPALCFGRMPRRRGGST